MDWIPFLGQGSDSFIEATQGTKRCSLGASLVKAITLKTPVAGSMSEIAIFRQQQLQGNLGESHSGL
jgi:hypothetical protein